MINIIMYNVKSKIENLNTLPYNVLNNILMSCSYVKKAFGVKPTRKYLIDVKSGITYTGLLSHIVPILKKNRIAYHINDMRVKPEKKYNWRIVNGFTMRDYQKRIVDKVVKTNRTIVSACTSAGKTFIMANLMVAFGCDCLVISPKASLSIQLRDEFQEFLGIKVGLINGTCVDYTDNGKKCPVIVGTPQTLLKYPEIVARAKAVLIDETHNEPADTIFKLTTMAVDAFFRVGVSGSPWRDDGCDIFLDAFAAKRNPKDTISATELINNGTLTPVSINWFNCNSGCDWLGDYATTYNQAIVNNSQRNTKAVELAVAHIKLNHPTLILFQKSKHGKKLLQILNDKVDNKTFDIEYNGTIYKVNTVELVDGTTDLDRREAVFKSIREGKTKCMIASTIADEGLSIKQLQVLIQCGGGKSTTRLFQRIGRVIRKCDGKEHAWVYDFMDSNDTMNLHSRTRYELIKLEPAFKQTVHDINYIPEEVKKAS